MSQLWRYIIKLLKQHRLINCESKIFLHHNSPLNLNSTASFTNYLIFQSNVYWNVHHCNSWRMKDQLDVTCYFISLLLCSTTQNQPHQISNTQQTENKTTDVVIQQHSRKLLMMDILMPETCRAQKKWNKIVTSILSWGIPVVYITNNKG